MRTRSCQCTCSEKISRSEAPSSWRAIRYGLSGELIDLTTGEVRPARAHLERLLDWIQPVADELGTSSLLAIPASNAAERQRARFEQGATLAEIYAEQVAAGEPVRG